MADLGGTGRAPAAKLVALTERPEFIALARASSVMASIIGAGAVWIFLQVWADLRTLAESDRAQAIEIAVAKSDRTTLGRRVDRLEDRVFPERRSDSATGLAEGEGRL